MEFNALLSTGSLPFREIKVRHYKDILKNLLGESPDCRRFAKTICSTFSEITTHPREYFESLNVLDFLLFLIHIRIYGKGTDCELIIQKQNAEDQDENNTDEQNEDNTKTKNETQLKLNLHVFCNDLKKYFAECNTKKISWDKFELELSFPTISRLLESEENMPQPEAFIKSISFNTEKISFKNNEQAKTFLQELPPKPHVSVIQFYKKALSLCYETNLLSKYKVKNEVVGEMYFAPTLSFITWFAQLIFEESLKHLFDNLFYLSYYAHINLDHIENSPIGEYIYYTNMLKSVLHQKSVDDE